MFKKLTLYASFFALVNADNFSMHFDGVDDWVGLSSFYSFESHLTFQAWINSSSEGDFNGNDAGKCIYAHGAQAGAFGQISLWD